MPFQHNENSVIITIDSNRVDLSKMEVIPTKSVCWIDKITFDPNTMGIVQLCAIYCEVTYCCPVASAV